ncbi:MAG: NADH-quinone oxidoreductase subunit C, partial [Paracoccaceae bacterium]
MTESLNELGAYLEAKRPDCILAWDVTHGELNVQVAPSAIVGFVAFLAKDATCRFTNLVDLTAVDYPQRPKRFDVVYHFLSMYQNHRIRVIAAVREDEFVASIVDVHPSA